MKERKEEILKLTIIVPSFNEERNIEKCLESVTWADEILVVDSFSTDHTLEIAKQYAHRILQHEYVNSAAQKNWAIPQAKYEWVMIVDCDERVPESLAYEIRSLLDRGPARAGYSIRRNNYLFGRRVRFSGWGKDSVLRLFKKDTARYKRKRVHAKIEIDINETGWLEECLEHYSISSMREWINKINRYSSWKAEDKFDKGMKFPVLQLIIRPPFRFFKDFVLRKGLLDGWRGFLIAGMSAFAELAMTAKVVEQLHEKKRRPI